MQHRAQGLVKFFEGKHLMNTRLGRLVPRRPSLLDWGIWACSTAVGHRHGNGSMARLVFVKLGRDEDLTNLLWAWTAPAHAAAFWL
jgi:hypothetical protein